MNELFLEVYRTRHSYHDAKERMVWLASTVYLGFAFATVDWLWRNTSSWNTPGHRWYLYAIVSAVFISAILFAIVQNWYKAQTVVITDELTRLIKVIDRREPNSGELLSALHCADNLPFWKRVGIFFTYGTAGLIGITLMIAMFAFQLSLIGAISDP